MGVQKGMFGLGWCLLVIFSVVTLVAYALELEQVSFQLPAAKNAFPDLYEASISELQAGLQNGDFSSVDLVEAYLARIEEVNLEGPALRAVLETNPCSLQQATALDDERRTSGSRGPLHGIPILLKDNIATLHSEGMNTTAGSYALLHSVVPRDAHVSAKLRAAGAILLGKASLSEWAHARGTMPSGFSGRIGQGSSPYVPLGDPCGSSSGSGAATAIGLAAASLGTETHGSIMCPSSFNNLVGVKPTVGLTSRDGVIPISEHQDSVGPMTRSVADAAVVLSIIAGPDQRDNYTLAQPPVVPDYTKALNANALRGVRLGVPRQLFRVNASGFPVLDEHEIAAFNASLDTLRALGVTVVDPADFVNHEELVASKNETAVMSVDLKYGLNRYISELVDVPTGVKDLAGLIAFNEAHADLELVEPYWTDQSTFIRARNSSADQAYFDAVVVNKELGGKYGIDATLQKYDLDALLLPTLASIMPAAIAGYPLVTVPLGFLPPDTPLAPAEPTRKRGPNQPFGLAFMGTAWSEFQLISYAYAYERATHTRLKVRAYPEAIPTTQLDDVQVQRRARNDGMH
ncbi:amidase signature enzyme [Lentinus tigrinus ALCF2SS1-7]|uniref:amidase signature enzyme n=1 Tax=Lentinus tigrinus ALCF2SS1-7 TaxID=1328758 RepID=UPI001165FD0B|nr:amidase signature enzyme [Lentinus tigrinus ALCF2SS1-7]